MGYRNLDSFYTTSRMIAAQLGITKKEFDVKFRRTLSKLGFEDPHIQWYKSYGAPNQSLYIFSGENVIPKIEELFKLVKRDMSSSEKEISDILVSILPDEKYRTVAARYENVITKDFNPELDPRSEGVRWLVSNHFSHSI